MDESRVAEITVGARLTGSGYLVASGLVLTAQHAVGFNSTNSDRLAVRFTDEDDWIACAVRWRSSERLDAALLEITDERWLRGRRHVSTRWGNLAGRSRVDCTVTGFPQFAQRRTGIRDIERLPGVIEPTEGSATSGWVIRGVSSNVPPGLPLDTSTEAPLDGLTGAPVFVDDLMIGMLSSLGTDGRLRATRTTQLARDNEFAQLVSSRSGVPLVPESVELARIARSPLPLRTFTSPVSLLAPEAWALPFSGREEELQSLRDWSEGSGVQVCLCMAPPGFGKSRLALQFAVEMARREWAVGVLRRDTPSHQLERIAELQAPTLLVVDDGEAQTDQLLPVLEQAARRTSDTPFRLLVLARTEGPWWDSLIKRTKAAGAREALSTARAMPLPPQHISEPARAEAFENAVRGFIPLLSQIPDLSNRDWQGIAETISQPPLGKPAFDAVGSLQAAALRALLAAAPDTDELLGSLDEFEARVRNAPQALPESQSAQDPASSPGSLHTRGFGDRLAEADLIGRTAMVAAITDLLAPPEPDESATGADAHGPTVVALEGPWGSGKSTTMRFIEQELIRRRPQPDPKPERWSRRWWWSWWWRLPMPRHLSVRSALRILGSGKKETTRRGRHRAEALRGLPVIAHFNPWAHQSNEQIWAGLTRSIIEAAHPVLGADDRARERYWLFRNRLRLERRHLRRKLWRSLASPLLRLAVFALLPPLIAQLVKADQTYTVWGHTLTAPKLALAIPAGLLGAGLLHTAARLLFGRARSFLPGDVLDGPVLSGALAPGMGGTADPALRDPYFNARSGYLYLVQHDISELLASLRGRGHELIVFIDDLDRCTPGTTAQVFEAINLFLSGALQDAAPCQTADQTAKTTWIARTSRRTGDKIGQKTGLKKRTVEQAPQAQQSQQALQAPKATDTRAQCRFVIGLDPAVVAGHLDQAFKDLQPEKSRPSNGDPSWGWTFLRKLIQLPVILPPITDTGIDEALSGLLGSVPQPTPQSAPPAGGGETEPAAQPTAEAPETASLVFAPAPDPDPEPDIRARALETNPAVRALIQQRLYDQPDLSIRETKRLLTIWQFYLRVVGHKERGADQLDVEQALHLVVLAEIAARWPALQCHLRRPVDGRPGLHWLALARQENKAWEAARERTALQDEGYNHACDGLRALLQKHDGEQVAAMAERL
ncbi:P-loop NTPase fold protein [Streptomyces sp. R35]|uniref:P-loop NTPase fold protein n=1 Tax=Streptomyces sp. R35 TaxID=3238630 RepID=A0AB39SQ23_9ACTN